MNPRTQVDVIKQNALDEVIPGAVLQILNESKQNVIEDNITSTEGLKITGVLEVGKTYYLHEVTAPTGYQKSADVAFTVGENGKARVVMEDPWAVYDMSVTKTVSGNYGNKGEIFTIDVHLERNGVPFTGTLNYSKGAETGILTFTAGTAPVQIKHGETVVIHDVEYGLTYTVTEQSTGQDKYTVTYTNAQGTITGNTTVSVKNRRDMVLPTGLRVPANGVYGAGLLTLLCIILLIVNLPTA